MHQLQKGQKSAPLGQKIVDNEHPVLGGEEIPGQTDGVGALVGVAVNLGGVYVAGNVVCGGLLGEYHGNPEIGSGETGDPYAGRFDGQNLGNALVPVQAVELAAQLGNEGHVDLMVEKAVHLQDVPRADLAVFQDSVFQQLHMQPP